MGGNLRIETKWTGEKYCCEVTHIPAVSEPEKDVITHGRNSRGDRTVTVEKYPARNEPARDVTDCKWRAYHSNDQAYLDANSTRVGDFQIQRMAAGREVWLTKHGNEIYDSIGQLNFENGVYDRNVQWVADVRKTGWLTGLFHLFTTLKGKGSAK